MVGIYRLLVMSVFTEDLLSTGPGSLNSSNSKATFYVFHIAPEWLSLALFLSVNVRKHFDGGDRLRERVAACNVRV